MTDQKALLDEIRREIDAIDTELHDLLMRRFALSERIAAAKAGGVKSNALPLAQAVKPGREAEIIRRLLIRHEGSTPPSVIVRLWREIVTASLMLQTPISVEIFGGEIPHDIWDMSRGYFGATVPVQDRATAKEVLRDLSNGECSFGVLPIPQQDEREPWWPQLSTLRAGTPRIIARLPFAGPREGPSAFLVAPVEPDDAGEMVSVFTLVSNQALSRNRINGWLEQPKMGGHCLASLEYGGSGQDYLHLMTFAGSKAADDPIFAELGAMSGGALREPTYIGAYPKPVVID
jgi:chorismate mutase / prephenate dehydratase